MAEAVQSGRRCRRFLNLLTKRSFALSRDEITYVPVILLDEEVTTNVTRLPEDQASLLLQTDSGDVRIIGDARQLLRLSQAALDASLKAETR